MFLESKNKFNITSPMFQRSLSTTDLAKWSADNMYRTSYSDMSEGVKLLDNLPFLDTKEEDQKRSHPWLQGPHPKERRQQRAR
jgi:hypothetical protein